MNAVKLRTQVKEFLLEDIGHSDITSSTIFSKEDRGEGTFIAKENGIISGLKIIQEAYQLLDPTIAVAFHVAEGEKIRSGQSIATIKGSMANMLTGERVVLNLLQRMSGIATMTNQCIETLNDSTIQICDTRKTAPGLRLFEKYAVTTGGGKNHRMGLYDGVMIKDNHIRFCGSITKAVRTVREQVGHMCKIEVETETKSQVEEAVAAGADIIMFDNRTPNEVKEFSASVPNNVITEASGGITLANLASYANSGIDFISLGFITHSVRAFDISLQV